MNVLTVASLLLAAVAIQIAMLAFRLETFEEARVIFVFHVVGTVMEIFKTSVGSWLYPEPSLLRIGGVPLFSGFMYAAIGSYIARCVGPNVPGLPAYVGLPSAQSVYLFPGYMGSAYLGAKYNPFDVDQLTLNIDATVAKLREKGVNFDGDIMERGFGRATSIILPDGGRLALYQPSHPTATAAENG